YTENANATYTQAVIINATASATLDPEYPLREAVRLASTPMTSNAQWETLYPDGFVWESNGVPMVLVPAGCFTIGSTGGDSDERNGNQMCFNQPFWIDQMEVSQEQFARFGGTKETRSEFPRNVRPVENI